MFLSTAATRRPIAMTCVILVLIVFGVVSYNQLGVDFYPNVDIPYVTITATYPGASPAEIEVDVAKRLEDAVGTLDGLKEMNTTCMENYCQITLEFQLSTNVDIAAMDVREKIDLVKNDLPSAVEDLQILKYDTNATAVVTMMLIGEASIDQLYDYADDQLKNRFSSISGVAEVTLAGGEELEMHVLIDREKLSSSGISILKIIELLDKYNVKIPSGRVNSGRQEINITFDSEYKSIEDLGSLDIGVSNGRHIYLRDVATISMQSEEKRSLAFFDGENKEIVPGIILKVIKKGESNAVEVIKRVRARLQELEDTHQIPGGMKLVWVRDSGEFIQASVDDAWTSIWSGIALTAIILFLFLHEIRSTFIVALSMPISIVITFWIMSMCGYTLNTFTLLALGTSVGTLVSNSIVVIENIITKLAGGADLRTASEVGTGEVALPVFASAMTNVVVFGPIAMMSSLVGKFLAPFAVTISIATLASLFVSFTMTPILAMIMLRREPAKHTGILGGFFRLWDAAYGRFDSWFNSTVDWVGRHPVIPIIAALVLLAATLFAVVPRVGSTFVPNEDQGELTVRLEFPTYYNLNTTTEAALDITRNLRDLPDVLRVSTVMGKVQGQIGQASEGVYLAELNLVLRKKTDPDRQFLFERLREMIRRDLAALPNCIVTVNIPNPISGGASTDMDLKIAGSDFAILNDIAERSALQLRDGGMATDVDTNVREGKPEIKVFPRYPVLKNLDISPYDVGMMLRATLEGVEVGSYKIGDRSFDVRVKSAERAGLDQLKDLTFGSTGGKPLNVGVVATFKPDSMPIQINRNDRDRVTKVFANPADGVGLGDLVGKAESIIKPMLPEGYKLLYGSRVRQMDEAAEDFVHAIVLAILLTYLLIAATLESWTEPFIIMFTVPLALIGMYAALWIGGIPMSIFGSLGFVMLIGIVVNNAILIMDDVAVNRRRGLPGREAMKRAVKNKFRPIVMTSIAAVLGILPMAVGTGLGSETRASCGVGVVGGLISSTVLSLYVIPAVYILFSVRRTGTRTFAATIRRLYWRKIRQKLHLRRLRKNRSNV